MSIVFFGNGIKRTLARGTACHASCHTFEIERPQYGTQWGAELARGLYFHGIGLARNVRVRGVDRNELRRPE